MVLTPVSVSTEFCFIFTWPAKIANFSKNFFKFSFFRFFLWNKTFFLQIFETGMSEIRDRAQAAPVKSRKFRDNGLPVSG